MAGNERSLETLDGPTCPNEHQPTSPRTSAISPSGVLGICDAATAPVVESVDGTYEVESSDLDAHLATRVA